MKYSHHARVRMGQRGIPDSLVDIAMQHGRTEGDRYVLDRRELRQRLSELDTERRKLLKLIDKGGITVATSGDTVITAFNHDKPRDHV